MTYLTGSHIFRSWPGIQLTLIVLHEVKVDWPALTSNSQQNCFKLDFKWNTYSCKRSSKSLWASYRKSKTDVLTYFHKKSDIGVTLLTPPLPLGFTAVTDHQGPKKSHRVVVPSLVCCQLTFQSVSDPRPRLCRVQESGRFSVGPAIHNTTLLTPPPQPQIYCCSRQPWGPRSLLGFGP
jgi:hypothetical protein